MHNIDESDQAGLIKSYFDLHCEQAHGGKVDPECSFCKNFIIQEKDKVSYSFIIFDVTDKNNDNG